MRLPLTNLIEAYPAYRPSGVPWLGDVPAHWEVRRLRTVAEMRVSNVDKHSREDEFPVRLCNYVDVYKNDRIIGAMPFMNATASRDEIARFRLEPGDVLITKDSEAWDDIGVPSLVVGSAEDLISGYHLALLRPFEEVLGAYLALTLQSRVVAYQFHVSANGVTRYGLTHTGIQSVQIPLPPLPEQRAIVRYLDYVDRRIRRYVAAKRKLIVLLDGEKQAIVNQAVTRGLDSNVRLKPSGVEWLSDMPEHWEIPRLRNLGDALIGLTYDPQDLVGEEDGILVLRASNILDGQLVYGDNVYVRSAVPSKLITREGDILICSRSGSRALVGKNARIRAESAGTTFGAFMTVFRSPHNDYLHQVFNSKFFEYQSATFFTSTINQLTLGILYNMKIPFPPFEERQSILRYVEETTAPINKAIARTRCQIELVQEYRTRLIADVVTGKLDVRDAAAQLPDEADDQDPIGESDPLADGLPGDLYDIDESIEDSVLEQEVTT